MKKIYKKGFTLIELLVVISIISLLSSVVLASVYTGREKAVLTKTVAEMKSLQTAVELYRNQFGVYPGVTNILYSDARTSPTPANWSTWNYMSPATVSLNDLQNTYLISNNLLAKPVLAPTYLESCDTGCYNKGYELLYVIPNPTTYSFVFSCGGVPVNNYIIFLLANTKKLNLPLASVSPFPGATWNAGSVSAGTGGPNTPPYTYCLSM